MSVLRTAGFVGVTFAFVVVMVGTTLPTPLYPFYEQELGFGQLTVTVVFAAYAVGVIAALLLLGTASDVLGRRRVLFIAIAVSALSTLVFVTSPALGWLYVGRVLSGISAGLVTTTATVYLVELAGKGGAGKATRAALVATAANMLGLGLGPLVAGVLSEVFGAPLITPYAVHLGLLALALAAVLRAPETVEPKGGSLRPTRPAVAPEARAVFVPVAIAAFAGFAALGLVTSVSAGILTTVLDRHDRALTGVVVFTIFAASTFGQVALRGVPTRTALRLGCVVLAVGATLLGASLPAKSLVLLVVALVVIGIGQALCFRAGIAEISSQSPPAKRAQTVTSFFLVAYVGISFPVVLVGLAAGPMGLRDAAIAFSAAVALLAVASLVAQLVIAKNRTPG
ncbi:MFS transporter [Antrihabitans spumae]|uniref:MFS transporter n=1 Tax=Antrihabitans spumae TaxID=3373370 RepID=A0ABW7KL02_9NOCA